MRFRTPSRQKESRSFGATPVVVNSAKLPGAPAEAAGASTTRM
jgi:hypothetical protein